MTFLCFQNVTESTSQVSTVNQPETTTLPSLLEEGKAKSRRKPGFRSEEEPSFKDEGEDVKDVSFDDVKPKGMDIKKDGKNKQSKKKGPLKDQLHGKKEIRQEDEVDKTDLIKPLNTNKNVTANDKVTAKTKNATEKPWPSFDKKEINRTLSNNNEAKTEVVTTSTPKSTTEDPFKIKHSVVKIVPLRDDPKQQSSTSTSKR